MSRVSYELSDGVATVVMDDGKVNALSIEMLGEIDAAIERARSDDAIIVFAGREGRFSAGFDLSVISGGGGGLFEMLRAGFDVAEKLLSFPRPVVIGCTGHAIAMGVFLVLSGDYRIGAAGPYRITANEVAIGLTMPKAAIEISRQRLTPAGFNRAMNLAEVFSPRAAVEAGFLDRVVEGAEVISAAQKLAREYTALNRDAHANTKLRSREQALNAIRAAIEEEMPKR